MAAEIVAFPFSRRVGHLEKQANRVLHQNWDAARTFLKLASERYHHLLALGISEPDVFAECSNYHTALWDALNRQAYLEGKPGVPTRELARGKPAVPQIPEPARQAAVPEWKQTARWCHARQGALNEKERAFIGNMGFVIENPTEKQITWLGDIYDALQSSKTA